MLSFSNSSERKPINENIITLNKSLLRHWIDFLRENNRLRESEQLKDELCAVLLQSEAIANHNRLLDCFLKYIDSPTPQSVIIKAKNTNQISASPSFKLKNEINDTPNTMVSILQNGFTYHDELSTLKAIDTFHLNCQKAFRVYWNEANQAAPRLPEHFKQRLQTLNSQLLDHLAQAHHMLSLNLKQIYTQLTLQEDRALIKLLLNDLEPEHDPDLIIKTDADHPESHQTLSEKLNQIHWFMSLHCEVNNKQEIKFYQIDSQSGSFKLLDFDPIPTLKSIVAHSKKLREIADLMKSRPLKRLKLDRSLSRYSRVITAPLNKKTFLGMELDLSSIPTLTVGQKKIHFYINTMTLLESNIAIAPFLNNPSTAFEFREDNIMGIPVSINGKQYQLPMKVSLVEQRRGDRLWCVILPCDQDNNQEVYIGFVGQKKGQALYHHETYDLHPPIQPRSADDQPLAHPDSEIKKLSFK